MTEIILYKKKKIRYKIRGKDHDKTIVLLHGFLESMKIWNKLEKVLSTKFRVISIDLPGFGKSELVHSIQTMDLMADVVNKILLQLKVNKCMMVGQRFMDADNRTCCEGLTEVIALNGGVCDDDQILNRVCVKLDDGICGASESQCNSPQDC